MRIVNTTRVTVVAHDAEVAATFWRRFFGLMGRGRIAPGSGLVIEPCRSIHTMFMRFPIDVVYVDNAWHVIKVVRNLRPLGMSAALFRSRRVIELPVGTIAATGTEAGDALSLSRD